MDLAAVLAYKSLFFANRARGTFNQAEEGKKYTALANGARCIITSAQTAVPLFAVSECLARTSPSPTVKNFASNLSNSNLKHIAATVSAPTTASAINGISGIVRTLAKLGLVGNLVYATAKCIDAEENDKTEVFMKASGNCAGMYLFENIYANVVKAVKPTDMAKLTPKLTPAFAGKIPFLKSVNLGSILIGIGFVAASLLGCYVGEKIGKDIFDNSKAAEIQKRNRMNLSG